MFIIFFFLKYISSNKKVTPKFHHNRFVIQAGVQHKDYLRGIQDVYRRTPLDGNNALEAKLLSASQEVCAI